MRGKDKCKALKEIRRQIAENNDIEYVVSECKHKGECRGTCPKCEAEVLYLERELAKRRNLGKTVVVAGLAAGMVASVSGCSLTNVLVDPIRATFSGSVPDPVPLEGEAMPVDPVDIQGDETYIPIDVEGDVEVAIDTSETPCEDDSCVPEDGSEETSKFISKNVSHDDLQGGAEYNPNSIF